MTNHRGVAPRLRGRPHTEGTDEGKEEEEEAGTPQQAGAGAVLRTELRGYAYAAAASRPATQAALALPGALTQHGRGLAAEISISSSPGSAAPAARLVVAEGASGVVVAGVGAADGAPGGAGVGAADGAPGGAGVGAADGAKGGAGVGAVGGGGVGATVGSGVWNASVAFSTCLA